jgi:hypothetical protein
MKLYRAPIAESATPENLAEAFWDLNHIQQANFFNHLALISNPTNFTMQLDHIVRDGKLSDKARYILWQFGQYSDER